ncbi:WG repeat-containing protein [Aquirufa ecclesiirivi]|uniref:WG repeat-containing protein n=1 Tax=Aquirufa ecclesiirivi TaxID=2715124 RepID=A0ABT4JK50_9BACT|nr:WG repeat-containing protein [Aquirufa ecclesiirivi]MCZ2475931.1 WG repeat-containing protein [Aquirufa ecclesiirivi]
MSDRHELEEHVPYDLIPRIGDIDDKYFISLHRQKEYMFRNLDSRSSESIVRSVLLNYLSFGTKNIQLKDCPYLFILDEYIILNYLNLFNDYFLKEIFENFYFRTCRINSDPKFEIGSISYLFDDAGLSFSSNVAMVVNISSIPQHLNLPLDWTDKFENEMAILLMNGFFGFYNVCGEIVIAPQFEKVNDFQNGFARVYQDGQVAFINTRGFLITEFCFEDARDFNQGLAPVKKGGRWFYLNTLAIEPFESFFDDADVFIDGLARVKLNGQFGFINLKGELSIPCIYTSCLLFQEDLVAVESNGKWGFLNRKGELIIDFLFDFVGYGFSENCCAVELAGRMGFINKRGEKISPFVFESKSSMGRCMTKRKDNIAYMKLSKDWGYVDTKTREVKEKTMLQEVSCIHDFEKDYHFLIELYDYCRITLVDLVVISMKSNYT